MKKLYNVRLSRAENISGDGTRENKYSKSKEKINSDSYGMYVSSHDTEYTEYKIRKILMRMKELEDFPLKNIREKKLKGLKEQLVKLGYNK